jgi:FMN reductase
MTELPLRPGAPGPLAMTRPPRLAVIVGHPRTRSGTGAVATRVGQLIGDTAVAEGRGPFAVDLVTVAELAPHLATPQSAAGATAVDEALAVTVAARLLVVASPTYKGTFSGVLKAFLDLLPRNGLADAVAVAVMTAATRAHSHAVDTYLRPLLMELGAVVPAPGVCVLDSEVRYLDDVLAGWVRRGGPAVLGVLDRMPADRA